MTEISQAPPHSRMISRRNPEVRSAIYQVLALGAVFAAGYYIFLNTLFNLEKRGITFGFSFLQNEAGVGVSEVMPIPRLEGGFLPLMAAIFAGLLAVYLLNKWATHRNRSIGGDYRRILLSLFLVVGVPAKAWYAP